MPSSYATDDVDADGVSYARDGSVFAKLFKKNRPDVAVGDEVVAHQNGHEDGDASDAHGENEDSGDEARHMNGNGTPSLDDEEEEDDEFLPPPSDDEDSGESDDDAGDDDLDDEETSMRSLLLPMATYAKQLLFLHEDDDGDFDEQDAELWESPEEKREWIARYEAMNREYMDQYGCRIDAPANPELKKRLRRERNREAKYSLVFLVLALAYLVRLLVGPSDDIPSPIASPPPAVTAPAAEPASSSPAEGAPRDWTSSTPTWWTVWTEELVVKALTWSRSAIANVHPLQPVAPVASQNDAPTESSPQPPGALAPATSAADRASESETPTAPAGKSNKVVVEREVTGSASIEDVESTTQAHKVAQDIQNVPPGDEEPFATGSEPRLNPVEEEITTYDVVVDRVSTANEADTGMLDPIPSGSESGASTALPSTSNLEGPPELTVVEEVNSVQQTDHQDEQRRIGTAEALKRCSDMFYGLVKSKHDTSVKEAALGECDQAVEVANDPASAEWIHARILRGDMRSLIQQFREAQVDYESALLGAAEISASRSEIEIKIACNRWIEFYHTKQFKELRNDCQRLSDQSSLDEPTDRIVELARDWLRAFRKETKVLEVLTKTRAWTLYRPTFPQKHNE